MITSKLRISLFGLMILILVMPSLVLAQYYGERTTEQSFEQSALFFNSYFYNPYGIGTLNQLSAGLIDDPFVNAYLNPAIMPNIESDKTLINFEFRGDRTEPEILDFYPMPVYDYGGIGDYAPYVDPRWIHVTRGEPEPVISLAVMRYVIERKLYVASSYQVIFENEPYYSNPYWIYNWRYNYDNFGGVVDENAPIPTIDRSYGEDEMQNRAHLLSFISGYQLTEKMSAGMFINYVNHGRDGSYVNSYQDEYTSNPNQDNWRLYQMQSREEDYSHIDLSASTLYQVNPDFNFGLKLGYLNGQAEQFYDASDTSSSRMDAPSPTDNWYHSLHRSFTAQSWDHDGNTKYASINFLKKLKNDRQISGYYRITLSSQDLLNKSSIDDTSYYAGQWTGENYFSSYISTGSMYDHRTGEGDRDQTKNEGLLNLHWKLNKRNKVTVGFYLASDQSEIKTVEPVKAQRVSDYESHWQQNGQSGTYDYYSYLFEDKKLDWLYKVNYFTFQIPVIFELHPNDDLEFMLGINRKVENWEIEEVTTAYFNRRIRTDQNQTSDESNFAEKYTSPKKNRTEKDTDFIARCGVKITEDFKINLLVDPEFESNFRIAQWWLNFQSNF